MKPRNLLCFTLGALLLLGGYTCSSVPDEAYPTGPEAGQDLAAQLRSLRPEENLKWQGTLNIYGREKESKTLSIACETTLTDTNWSVTYWIDATETSPAEKLTVLFSTNSPTQYLYARASAPGASVGELKKLTGAEADIPLAGSDFWISDLGFEFYHWPEQIRHKGEMQRGRPCYVLESVNPQPQPGSYSRVMTYVEKESNQPLEAKAYGANKKSLLKEFEVGSIVKINGHYHVKDLKMFNRETGSRTYLNFHLPEQ